MQNTSEPLATLYVYTLDHRVVALAVGHAPPDPGVPWDALTRIPIMENGDKPPWRAFTWRANETIARALERSRWPGDEPDPHVLRLHSARQARRDADGRRRSPSRTRRPSPLPPSGGGPGRGLNGEGGASSPAPPPPIAPAPLGQAPSGVRYTFDRRTRQYLRVAPEVTP